jgi:pentatricopeptide repeat protein
MLGFEESEQVRFEYAKASVNLIDACAKVGELGEARMIFEIMQEFGFSRLVAGERADAAIELIDAYRKAGNLAEAWEIFDVMQVGKSERMLDRRAVAAIKLMAFGIQEKNCTVVQKTYATMAKLGDSRAVVAIREQATGLLSLHCPHRK